MTPRTQRFRARRLILHLGLAKTGTTLLQESLHASRAALLSQYGMLYPSMATNHYHFQTVTSRRPETLIQVRRDGVSEPGAARRLGQRFLEAFEEEISQTRPDTIVISSEYFASMPADEFSELLLLLRQYADEISAVLYMRDPWSYTLSLVQQYICDGLALAPVRPGYASGQVELIQKFEEVLGDALQVRPYLGGAQRTDILADFCTVAGIDARHVARQSGAAENKAIGHIRATIIAEFNALWPQYDGNGLYIQSNARDAAMRHLLELPLQDRKMELSRRHADIIATRAAADMAYVERRYFSGQPVFSGLIKDVHFRSFNEIISMDTLGPDDLRHYVRATIHALRETSDIQQGEG